MDPWGVRPIPVRREDFEEGFKKFTEVDDCPIREYLRTYTCESIVFITPSSAMTVRQLDYYTIQWLETSFAYVVSFSGGLAEGCISPSNLFDQAFSEYAILGANFTDRPY